MNRIIDNIADDDWNYKKSLAEIRDFLPKGHDERSLGLFFVKTVVVKNYY
ncbi:hypothetical protein [Chryseobacterium ureilyticum]|nr:hypothetical protein [Chryseobacterium ureilyticum]